MENRPSKPHPSLLEETWKAHETLDSYGWETNGIENGYDLDEMEISHASQAKLLTKRSR